MGPGAIALVAMRAGLLPLGYRPMTETFPCNSYAPSPVLDYPTLNCPTDRSVWSWRCHKHSSGVDASDGADRATIPHRCDRRTVCFSPLRLHKRPNPLLLGRWSTCSPARLSSLVFPFWLTRYPPRSVG
jgi:hypothetical protein